MTVGETVVEKLERHVAEAEDDARRWAGSKLAMLRLRDARILRFKAQLASWLDVEDYP